MIAREQLCGIERGFSLENGYFEMATSCLVKLYSPSCSIGRTDLEYWNHLQNSLCLVEWVQSIGRDEMTKNDIFLYFSTHFIAIASRVPVAAKRPRALYWHAFSKLSHFINLRLKSSLRPDSLKLQESDLSI